MEKLIEQSQYALSPQRGKRLKGDHEKKAQGYRMTVWELMQLDQLLESSMTRHVAAFFPIPQLKNEHFHTRCLDLAKPECLTIRHNR